MSIANSYPIDKNIENQDLLIGTKYSNRQTVNFPVESFVAYINNKGKVSIAGQSSWKFVTETPVQGTLSFLDLEGDNTPFSSITSLRIAANDLGNQNVVDFFSYIVGAQIMISEQNGISFFGHYKVISYIQDALPNFYIINLEYLGGYGAIIGDLFYDISLFDPFPNNDKTYIYTQAVPSVLWEIQHNLNKFPSVTVVNNNNIAMYGWVKYTDSNNLIIEFSAGFAGKAYIN